MPHSVEELEGGAVAAVDGGSMDCGSGLLLLLTRHMRAIAPGQSLLVRTEDASVPADLEDWSRLAGHEVVGRSDRGPDGAWHVLVTRGGLRAAEETAPATVEPAPAYTTGDPTALGTRVWLYSNFHCNLACGYCCSRSSPSADPRLMPVSLAESVAAELAAGEGQEVFVTGGEPFLHPQIGPLVAAVGRWLPVTLLTNAMILDRGARRSALEGMDRDRVTLQVSLDSAGALLHDRNRGLGSHARAVAGIEAALDLGFTVRIAATVYDDDLAEVGALTGLLDRWAIPVADRLIRPVARQGFADRGQQVTVDDLAPEPTVAVDGVWWHPVAVTDPGMLVAEAPLPLAAALETIRDTVAVQDAARRAGRRHVFRCA